MIAMVADTLPEAGWSVRHHGQADRPAYHVRSGGPYRRLDRLAALCGVGPRHVLGQRLKGEIGVGLAEGTKQLFGGTIN